MAKRPNKVTRALAEEANLGSGREAAAVGLPVPDPEAGEAKVPLGEDAEDLATFRSRSGEASIKLESLVRRLKNQRAI